MTAWNTLYPLANPPQRGPGQGVIGLLHFLSFLPLDEINDFQNPKASIIHRNYFIQMKDTVREN